jgi:hypothetical protein
LAITIFVKAILLQFLSGLVGSAKVPGFDVALSKGAGHKILGSL